MTTEPAVRHPRWQLTFACFGVLVAAADTYVVVLALVAIMADVGIDVTQLQRATPIISGFLLGYVVVLPLIGRLSDIYGRRPVFLGCLAVFAAGSLLTASAHDLGVVVAGRTLQGLGGGGLVPLTLALVADAWPAERRARPLGVVAAVQEVGSVIGPLYGAGVLAFSSWRTIFWINVPVAAVVGIGFGVSRGGAARRARQPSLGRRDVVGALLAVMAVASSVAAVAAPEWWQQNDVVGVLYGPVIAGYSWSGWTTPIALVTAVAWLAFAVWETVQPFGVRAMLPLRRLPRVLASVDWAGASLLAIALGLIVLTFATADPSRYVVADGWPWLFGGAAVAVTAFIVVELRSAHPLVPFRELSDRAAFGAVCTNLAIGAALMAALVDVPLFARATVSPDSQLGAAFVLVRLLAAVPVGALIGGAICERLSYRFTAALGMLMTGAAFVVMTTWSATTLGEPLLGVSWLHSSDPVLVAAGFGFGLAIPPVNAAILATVKSAFHGLAAALVVVARTIGMLAGLSVLTALGLHSYAGNAAALPSPLSLCPDSPLDCPAYDRIAGHAIVSELHTIFAGAAVAAGLAALLAAVLLRRPARLRTASQL